MGKLHIPRLSRKTNKKSAGAAAATLAVCLVLLAILAGAAIGRYQTRLKSDASVRAKEFYFTSDFLNGSTHTLAPGSTEITFTLGNHADDLRFSEVDITYKVTVTSDNGTTAAVDKAEGTLNMGSVQDAEITVSNLRAGTYTVTAIGKGGYEKSLTATIRVLSDEAQIYRHQETFPEYTLLTVWNEGDKEGSVTIFYTGIPDNTNPNMAAWTTAGETEVSQSVTIAPHESKVFRFFGERAIRVVGGTDKAPN